MINLPTPFFTFYYSSTPMEMKERTIRMKRNTTTWKWFDVGVCNANRRVSCVSIHHALSQTIESWIKENVNELNIHGRKEITTQTLFLLVSVILSLFFFQFLRITNNATSSVVLYITSPWPRSFVLVVVEQTKKSKRKENKPKLAKQWMVFNSFESFVQVA